MYPDPSPCRRCQKALAISQFHHFCEPCQREDYLERNPLKPGQTKASGGAPGMMDGYSPGDKAAIYAWIVISMVLTFGGGCGALAWLESITSSPSRGSNIPGG